MGVRGKSARCKKRDTPPCKSAIKNKPKSGKSQGQNVPLCALSAVSAAAVAAVTDASALK
jgi:hypothetical protein